METILLSIAGSLIIILLGVIAFFSKRHIEQEDKLRESLESIIPHLEVAKTKVDLHEKRLDMHEQRIDGLDTRVGRLEK